MGLERRNAYYDFACSPFSWDLLTFICAAMGQGANHIVFVPGERAYQKCTPEEQHFRMEHLLKPLALKAGGFTVLASRAAADGRDAVYPISYRVKRPVYGHMLGQLIGLQKARWPAASERAREVVASRLNGRVPFTITIRESRIKPARNSNIPEWLAVADWLREEGEFPLFVPDTDNMEREFGTHESLPMAALDVDVRLALYEAARCNLGINNGPTALCLYSRMPYLVFKMANEAYPETSAAFMRENRLPVGTQLPWRRPNQRIVWKDDTASVIIEALEQWLARGGRSVTKESNVDQHVR